MEKLIVLIPSKSSIDRLSIINMLQKYIGVIAAAFFASAGIEYFSAYMQAKKIFDASAPIRMAKNESAGASSQAVITETNVSSNFTTKSVLVQQTPDSGTMSASYETANAGTENVSTGMGSGPTTGAAGVQAVPASAHVQVSAPAPVNTATAVNATAVSAPAPVNTPTAVNATAVNAPAHNVTNSVYNTPSNPPSVSPESLAHVGGGHGLYDALSLHPGVWFLFGCVFIILLLIVREIYYKKRAK